MTTLKEMVDYIDTLLDVQRFSDYAPNGLQVEGRPHVETLVSGVTASMALLEQAHAAGADAILVHHGYFWRGEEAAVVSMKRQRLRFLLDNDISLLAYHLPLDAHDTLGNNAQLARLLNWQVRGRFGPDKSALAMYGSPGQVLAPSALASRLAQALGREPLLIPGGDHPIRSVGWCTGAAQRYIEDAARMGLDAYVSGEISEPTVHMARELGIHYFAAGHHATERYGVQALGEHLAETFRLEHRFIDVDNPV